jgi:hypothetical protein
VIHIVEAAAIVWIVSASIALYLYIVAPLRDDWDSRD